VADRGDQRSNLERLDDLQAAHPFPYNFAVGLVMGLVLFAIGLPFVFAVLYALTYAALRWFLWQEGRVLQRQYEARGVRWAQKQAERRRQRG
jgi:hypothetical protein